MISFILIGGTCFVITLSALAWGLHQRVIRDTRTRAIAEHIHDGLLLYEGETLTFANTLGRRLAALANEALERAAQSPAPVPHDLTLDGRKQHFLVHHILLDQGARRARMSRKIFVFQNVTFLRENEEAKVNFLATLSHEIKTPVTSLAMAIAMLERIGFDAELVRIANADVGRLRRLLEDLLNISKLNAVREPAALQKQETNIGMLVRQAVKASTPVAEEKAISLEARVGPRNPVHAMVDATKMTWVLSTLIQEAIQRTRSGDTIAVSLELYGSMAAVSVAYGARDDREPAQSAIIREIMDAHAGRFATVSGNGIQSKFLFSIHAYEKTNLSEVSFHEANPNR